MKKLLVIPILLLHYSAMLILFPIDITLIVLQRGVEFLSNVLERVCWHYDDGYDNVKPVKSSPTAKVDNVQALLSALWLYCQVNGTVQK